MWQCPLHGGAIIYVRVQVILLESSERVGGWMHSMRTEEGAVLELGPRSLRTAGPAGKTTLSLVSRLNP